MSTLSQRLDAYRAIFYEKGLQRYFTELKQLANSLNTTQLGAGVAFGTLDYTTNCTPDVADSFPNPFAERKIGGVAQVLGFQHGFSV